MSISISVSKLGAEGSDGKGNQILVACSQLYDPLVPSVGQLVRWSVGHTVKKNKKLKPNALYNVGNCHLYETASLYNQTCHL